jgi:DUF2934 family protein
MPRTAYATELQIETLPLEERIRRRAYELYVERGSESGSEFDDWLQAEEEIRRAEEQAVESR